ncbi:MAG: glucosyltransferase domain-containing protein [Anaerolineae bacterium]|nr:glucosyltransferase domain-containing protein [Anaerolineae bacterium]
MKSSLQRMSAAAGSSLFNFYLPWRALTVAALVGLLNFGVEITSLNLSIDDEVALHEGEVSTLWIARGRWGLFVLGKVLFSNPVVPNGPLLFSVLLLVVAAVLLCREWGLERQLDVAVVASVIVGFPAFSHILQFSVMSIGIGPGFLVVALATWLIGGRVTAAKLLGISALVAVALSFYQVFVVVALSAFIAKLALSAGQPANIKNLLKWFSLSVLSTGAGYLLHSLSSRLLIEVLQLPPDPYIRELQSPPTNWAEVLARAQQSAALTQRLLLGSSELFGVHTYALPVLLVFSAGLIVLAVFVDKERRTQSFAAAMLFAALFAINVLSGIGSKYIATRLMLGLAVLIGALSCVSLTLFKHLSWLKLAGLALAALVAFQFVQSNNRLLSSAKLAYEVDQHMARQVILEIERAELRAGSSAKYLEISGQWRPESTPAIARAEVIGASFFEWDGGSPYRVGFFLSANGFRLLRPAPFEARVRALYASLNMPAWPESGSVSIVGDVAVVKFGPLSTHQRQWILEVCTNRSIHTDLQELKFLCEQLEAGRHG